MLEKAQKRYRKDAVIKLVKITDRIRLNNEV